MSSEQIIREIGMRLFKEGWLLAAAIGLISGIALNAWSFVPERVLVVMLETFK